MRIDVCRGGGNEGMFGSSTSHLDIMTVVVDDGGGFDGAQYTNSLFISSLVCSVMEIGWMVEACLMMCNSSPLAANPPPPAYRNHYYVRWRNSRVFNQQLNQQQSGCYVHERNTEIN